MKGRPGAEISTNPLQNLSGPIRPRAAGADIHPAVHPPPGGNLANVFGCLSSGGSMPQTSIWAVILNAAADCSKL